MSQSDIKKVIKESYGDIAKGKKSCCESAPGICDTDKEEFAKSIGYTDEELKAIPKDANLSLGCGNPTALAGLKEGETVLDLGAGAGFDCFLAASKIGEYGKVIGVDITPAMVERARENAKKSGIKNIDFRLGEIENLPVDDNSIDVVISNCVINLSANKHKVFQEIYRVLKPGGRIAISDIALKKDLPKNIRQSIRAYVGCVAGAILIEDYKKVIESSGLKDVKISIKGSSEVINPETEDPLCRALLDNIEEKESLDSYIASIYIEGVK